MLHASNYQLNQLVDIYCTFTPCSKHCPETTRFMLCVLPLKLDRYEINTFISSIVIHLIPQLFAFNNMIYTSLQKIFVYPLFKDMNTFLIEFWSKSSQFWYHVHSRFKSVLLVGTASICLRKISLSMADCLLHRATKKSHSLFVSSFTKYCYCS